MTGTKPPERRHLAGWTGGIPPPSVDAAAGSRRSSRLEGGAPVGSGFTHALRRVPWITLAVALTAIVIPGRFEYDRAAILRGEVWRLATGHLTHWSPDHLLWDVIAFVTLGFVCERRHALYGAVLLASAMSVSLVLWIVCPEVTVYRGLSAVASALWFWAALIIAERRLTAAFVLFALFFGKVLIELSTGTSIFASGITVLPSVHLIGAAAGFCGAYVERKMTRLTNAAVHRSRTDHHLRRRRNEPAVVGRVA